MAEPPKIKLNFDEQKQCWIVDDFGRSRDATTEEIDEYVRSMQDKVNE